MKVQVTLWLALLALALAGPAARAHVHELSHGQGPQSAGLGTTHFPTSGAPRAQADFIRGLLLLHSFEYQAARRAFQAAQHKDPSFAMTYWGEALTYNQTLWGEQDLDAARAALAHLAPTAAQRAAKAPTARERAYLASVDLLYGEGDKASRDRRYNEALGALADAYPTDLDARALYSLSLLGLTNGARNVANYMRAAAQAQAVLDIDPQHPGALHYLIHAVDDPIHAPLGLSAARMYGKVAPGAEHALHMPSHIYFALGMWDEAIASNAQSVKVARAQHEEGYHSLLWLIYAYLQEGRRAQAEQEIASIAHDVEAGATKDNRSRLAYARAIWLIETQGAEGAQARLPIDSTGIATIGYFSALDFARGISAGADVAEARRALSQLQARVQSARAVSGVVAADWHDVVTSGELNQALILQEALEGTVQFREGDHAGGLARVREASLASDKVEFEYGPPWSAKPLNELLGELLVADGQRDEAIAAFTKTLAVYPNRLLTRLELAAAQKLP